MCWASFVPDMPLQVLCGASFVPDVVLMGVCRAVLYRTRREGVAPGEFCTDGDLGAWCWGSL